MSALQQFLNKYTSNNIVTINKHELLNFLTRKKTPRQLEIIRIKNICHHINTKSNIGLKLKYDYNKQYNQVIDVVEKAGNNTDHYDIMIHHIDNTLRKIEVKSSEKFKPIINDTDKPWFIGVQFLNGPGNKFSITQYYAKLWYDTIICNPNIITKYTNIPPPSFDIWKEKDAFKCGDPTSDFGLELKKNYRLKHPHNNLMGQKYTSMNGKFGSPIDYRKMVNDLFVFDQHKEQLIKEVQIAYNTCMKDKEGWLQTFGDINDCANFNYKWYNQIYSKTILDVKCIKKEDLIFKFICDDGYTFNAILRWGKGTGFSNIRLDLK
jgi:hypothetical protein